MIGYFTKPLNLLFPLLISNIGRFSIDSHCTGASDFIIKNSNCRNIVYVNRVARYPTRNRRMSDIFLQDLFCLRPGYWITDKVVELVARFWFDNPDGQCNDHEIVLPNKINSLHQTNIIVFIGYVTICIFHETFS